MSKVVQKHPTDEGKFQSAFDNYGHGEGNGKSRQAVYKYARKLKQLENDKVPSEEDSQTGILSDSPDNISSTSSEETIEDDENEWISISWAEDDGSSEVKPNTIPDPLHKLGKGSKGAQQINKARKAMQSHFVRWGFISLDRLVTWWGRGVMSKPKWELSRTEKDYDLLQSTTDDLLESYNIQIPASPWMVWGAVVSSAYVPPITHIHRNRDKTRKRTKLLPSFFPNPFKLFRRKKKINPQEVISNNEPREENNEPEY